MAGKPEVGVVDSSLSLLAQYPQGFIAVTSMKLEANVGGAAREIVTLTALERWPMTSIGGPVHSIVNDEVRFRRKRKCLRLQPPNARIQDHLAGVWSGGRGFPIVPMSLETARLRR